MDRDIGHDREVHDPVNYTSTAATSFVPGYSEVDRIPLSRSNHVYTVCIFN